VTLETAVTALARIGYMPVVRLSTTTSPPGVVIVSDPLVLTNDNQWVAVGKVPVDVPSAKARFGALEAEAILFPQPVTTGATAPPVASMFLHYRGEFKAIVISARWLVGAGALGCDRLGETRVVILTLPTALSRSAITTPAGFSRLLRTLSDSDPLDCRL
jgi:hypothetical protein